MPICDFCNKNIEGVLPHRCMYCGQTHCQEHLLPESHKCKGLEKIKDKGIKKWENTFHKYEKYNSRNDEHNHKKIEISKSTENENKIIHKKTNLFGKIKNYISWRFSNFTYWLKKREHHKYNFSEKASYLIKIALFFAISIVGISVFYTNAKKINDINLWIIRIGGVLLLISLFFVIKYGWRLLKEIISILRRQRNWVRCLIVILIILILWQGYTNKEDALNPVFDVYNKTNFSLFSPISFANINFDYTSKDSTISKDSTTNKNSKSGGGFLNLGADRDINVIEQEILVLVNEERQRYGARALTSKANLNTYARAWSDKMIAQDFFEHSKLSFSFPSTAGENIGETPIHYNVEGCGSTYRNSDMAKCFVNGWIGSPGHHENMIDKSFSMTGIGVSCDSSKCRATQVFSG